MCRATFAVAIVAATACKSPAREHSLIREPLSFTYVRDAGPTTLVHADKAQRAHETACPPHMVEVEGDYCPNVQETCLVKQDNYGRCAEWAKPSRCLSKSRVHMHYCIDEYEWPNVVGQKPKAWLSWYDAKREVEAAGKRLCTTAEWTLACEGPDMQPYPYGDGYHRDKTACNFDNALPDPDPRWDAKRPSDPASLVLASLLVPAGSMPRCVSPFGVYDTVGNVDEWVTDRRARSLLMSGHVFGVRNMCRGITDGHGPTFSWYETSTRACKDAQ